MDIVVEIIKEIIIPIISGILGGIFGTNIVLKKYIKNNQKINNNSIGIQGKNVKIKG